MDVVHLALAVGNYYANHDHKTVVLMEIEGEGEDVRMPASQLMNLLTPEICPEEGIFGFRFLNIEVHPKLCIGESERVQNRGFDVSIFIFRGLTSESYHSFLSCDQRFVVGSLVSWHRETYFRFLHEYMVRRKWVKQGDCYALTGYATGGAIFEETFGERVQRIPFIEDPEYLTQIDLMEIRKLMECDSGRPATKRYTEF